MKPMHVSVYTRADSQNTKGFPLPTPIISLERISGRDYTRSCTSSGQILQLCKVSVVTNPP